MKTIREVEAMLGITRRSLQEYASPKVGLLFPSNKDEIDKGHLVTWKYDNEAIDKLKLIKLFVEAGYTRKQIKAILADPESIPKEFDKLLLVLEEKRKRIDGLIKELKLSHLVSDLPYEILGPIVTETNKKISNGEMNYQEERKKIQQIDLDWDALDDEGRLGVKIGAVFSSLALFDCVPSDYLVQKQLFDSLMWLYKEFLKMNDDYSEDDYKKELDEALKTEEGRKDMISFVNQLGEEFWSSLDDTYGLGKGEYVKKVFDVFVNNGAPKKL